MMMKAKNPEICRDWANERHWQGKCWGFCVLDGFTYAGTRAELEAIACVSIIAGVKPKPIVVPQIAPAVVR